MPRTGAALTAAARARKARELLAGRGVARDDSDDELGMEDLPWEWLRAPNPLLPGTEFIHGARMGSFSVQLGDTVLLKAEGSNEAWVGLICEFIREEDNEDDEGNGEMGARFMWFSTEKEIRNKAKKRTDALPNELYITPAWDVNPLSSINGKAQVLSLKDYHARYPSGKVPRGSKDYGKVFICRRGCNVRTATYTEEFVWDEIYTGEADIDALVEAIKTGTKASRKRKRDTDSNTKADKDTDFNPTREARTADDYNNDDDLLLLQTPTKKRKYTARNDLTPRGTKPTPLTTPTHKRVIIKRPLEFTPLGTRILSPSHTSSSPFQLARTRLHVSSVPSALPCREEAFATVYSHLEAAITSGSGTCIYVSGTPGTGKTATVREVVAQLNAAVAAEELDDFVFVEINGMKVTDPHQSYSLLWEALQGDRVSPAHALDLLEREFSTPSPRRVPCVVLMDELDQLVTKSQSVMYNFFNWPGLRHSRLIVLAVANTMDLPERTLSNKISSRLGESFIYLLPVSVMF
jgi:origin recognition complex subunit 1